MMHRGLYLFRGINLKPSIRRFRPRCFVSDSLHYYTPIAERIQSALDMEPLQKHEKRLYLLDGMDPIFRVHYGAKERLLTEDGKDTTILRGFLRHLLAILSTSPPPDYCIVAFDAPGADFRSGIYSEYKSNRDPHPKEVIESLPMIYDALGHFGIKWVMVHSLEADDIISVLAKNFSTSNICAYIFSKDKDFFQLLDENIVYLRGPLKSGGDITKYTTETFKAKYGIEPRQYIDVLGLQGDTADNVPGVMNLGPKRALDLVQKFGSIESVFDNISEVKQKVVLNALQAPQSKNNAYISKELVTLASFLNLPPLRFALDDAKIQISHLDLRNIFDFLDLMHVDSLQDEVHELVDIYASTHC